MDKKLVSKFVTDVSLISMAVLKTNKNGAKADQYEEKIKVNYKSLLKQLNVSDGTEAYLKNSRQLQKTPEMQKFAKLVDSIAKKRNIEAKDATKIKHQIFDTLKAVDEKYGTGEADLSEAA